MAVILILILTRSVSAPIYFLILPEVLICPTVFLTVK